MNFFIISLNIFLLFGICLTLASAQNLISPEIEEKINQLLNEGREAQHVPAYGLAITKNWGGSQIISYAAGIGLRNVEENVPANDHTLFAIGSITKSFTALLVVKYLNEKFPELGESALDTPIRQLAPNYGFNLGDSYRNVEVTFRDLLSHRVCYLPELIGMWVETYDDEADIYLRQRYAPDLCALRNGYNYNNGLIGMAGDIIAHITGSTYGQLLSAFLTDLGMTNTTWVKRADNHNEMEDRAIPYLWKDNAFLRYQTEMMKGVEIVNGAGGILSSPSDMMKYMQFHLNKGKVGSVQVIPEQVMSWMYKISNPFFNAILKTEAEPNAVVDFTAGYALCLEVGSYDGYLRFDHGGYLPPFESFMTLYPDVGLGIFTTANGPGAIIEGLSGEFPQALFHRRIFDLVQGIERPAGQKSQFPTHAGQPQPKIIQNPKSPLISPQQAIVLPPEQMVGKYGNGLNGEFNITFQKNPETNIEQLFINYGKWGKGWLEEPTQEGYIYIDWTTDFWMMNFAYLLEPLGRHILLFIDGDSLVLGDEINGISSDVFKRML